MIFRHTYSELVLTEHSQGSRALRINKIDCPMIIPLSYYTLPYFGLILDGCCSATVSSCFGYFPKKTHQMKWNSGLNLAIWYRTTKADTTRHYQVQSGNDVYIDGYYHVPTTVSSGNYVQYHILNMEHVIVFFFNMKHRYWSLWPMILKYILRYNDDIPSNAYINMDWFKGNSTGNHKKNPIQIMGFSG